MMHLQRHFKMFWNKLPSITIVIAPVKLINTYMKILDEDDFFIAEYQNKNEETKQYTATSRT